MDSDEAWGPLLNDHPIFALKGNNTFDDSHKSQLELSTNTLSKFTTVDPKRDDATPSGRRQVMALRDADLVVAAGKELRITSLGDVKLGKSTRKTYKVLHTPNVDFEIHQIVLNPNGKLLAAVGAFRVAVVVMPRPGYNRLVSDSIDCKAVKVGQYYHGSEDSAPIAKVDWHPWGEAGSTLLVMTTDGRLREYDISFDAEEPQQTLSFVPQRKANAFAADDDSEREVTSFTLGKGKADWGPLTIYALMKSGDVYAICPYLPHNTVIPSSYVHSLECFISAKQEFIAQGDAPSHISTLYDYQRKYVNALTKQLPPGTVFPAASRPVSVHPPKTISSAVTRQGPFLLQPSPRILEGSEGGDATDIIYLEFGTDAEENEREGKETDHLGVIFVTYQDGKIDLLLDVDKVEARWDAKQLKRPNEFPMLAVYETIDLGLFTSLKQLSAKPGESPAVDLLRGNHPVIIPDPIHDSIVYVYHAFGVHTLNVSPVLENLAQALRIDDDDAESSLQATLAQSAQTVVQPILTTFSVDRRCSNPVISVAVPNDVYLTYSIFILTSVMRLTVFPLSLESETPPPKNTLPLQITYSAASTSAPSDSNRWLVAGEGPPSYVSLLSETQYKVPPILKPSGLPPIPKLSLPSPSSQFMLTPDTLRYIGKTIEQITGQIHELYIAQCAAEVRATLQKQELGRQTEKCREIQGTLTKLKQNATSTTETRLKEVEETQKSSMKRLDKLLQRLMERASPELSEQENKWFEELKRLKAETLGQGRYDEGSLSSRVKALERDYTRLLPSLKTLMEKEQQRNEKTKELNSSLGFTQAFEYGKRSNEDGKRITKLEGELNRLANKLDVHLPRPANS
ncbi:hypothetical protein FA15DRAFT_632177 [Coprinopsis marcescibilis]|uniref:Nucleoporin Nup82 n=1 Tax=Coprinopsis marcescibilis TaxID=230819 RepID=A0A5C3L8C5_COPMA|nr:hypothetical protein FA15DRAFT_632177 [Coprinopsis marcescibilis]